MLCVACLQQSAANCYSFPTYVLGRELPLQRHGPPCWPPQFALVSWATRMRFLCSGCATLDQPAEPQIWTAMHPTPAPANARAPIDTEMTRTSAPTAKPTHRPSGACGAVRIRRSEFEQGRTRTHFAQRRPLARSGSPPKQTRYEPRRCRRPWRTPPSRDGSTWSGQDQRQCRRTECLLMPPTRRRPA